MQTSLGSSRVHPYSFLAPRPDPARHLALASSSLAILFPRSTVKEKFNKKTVKISPIFQRFTQSQNGWNQFLNRMLLLCPRTYPNMASTREVDPINLARARQRLKGKALNYRSRWQKSSLMFLHFAHIFSAKPSTTICLVLSTSSYSKNKLKLLSTLLCIRVKNKYISKLKF